MCMTDDGCGDGVDGGGGGGENAVLVKRGGSDSTPKSRQ